MIKTEKIPTENVGEISKKYDLPVIDMNDELKTKEGTQIFSDLKELSSSRDTFFTSVVATSYMAAHHEEKTRNDILTDALQIADESTKLELLYEEIATIARAALDEKAANIARAALRVVEEDDGGGRQQTIWSVVDHIGVIDPGFNTKPLDSSTVVTKFQEETLGIELTQPIKEITVSSSLPLVSLSSVNNFHPLIQISKNAPTSAFVGNTLIYTFDVSHAPRSDGSDISNITLIDDNGTPNDSSDDFDFDSTFIDGDLNRDGKLNSGEIWHFETTRTILANDNDPLINTARVTGVDRDGDFVSDTDTHTVSIKFQPLIQISKNAPTSAFVGDTITYTFDVSHAPGSDGSDIMNVTISDSFALVISLVNGDIDSDDILDFGETWHYEASLTFDTTGTFTNTATVTGEDRDGNSISDTDSHTVFIESQPIQTLIQINKSGPDSALVGDTIIYTYDVSHAQGSDGSEISNINISDPLLGLGPITIVDSNMNSIIDGDLDFDNKLDANEIWQYTATKTILPTDPDPIENTATVTGVDSDGNSISDIDSHTVSIELFQPLIQISKDGPASALVGNIITYTFDVSHAPGSDGSNIFNIMVTDSLLDPNTIIFVDGDDGDKILNFGETWHYEASLTFDTSGTVTNTATVTGEDGDGDFVSDTDSHIALIELFQPLIQISKDGPTLAFVGDTITYTFDVSHAPGSDGSDITNVFIFDSTGLDITFMSGDDGDNILEFGETWHYEATLSNVPGGIPDNIFRGDFHHSRPIILREPLPDNEPLINTVVVISFDGEGDPIIDTDTHTVDVKSQIQIIKEGPESAFVGETITYTYAVSHTPGSDGSDISNITVIDDNGTPDEFRLSPWPGPNDNDNFFPTLIGGDTNGDGILNSDETWHYEATKIILINDNDPLINTARVTGVDPVGNFVSDINSHSVDIDFQPLIQIVKSGPDSAIVGKSITYTFDVSHAPGSDGSNIFNIMVTDSLLDPNAITLVSFGDGDNILELGETWHYEATRTILTTDDDPLENTAVVVGFDSDSDLVIDEDEHSIDIQPLGDDNNLIESGDGMDIINLTNDGETDTINYSNASEVGDTITGFDTDAPNSGAGEGDVIDISSILTDIGAGSHATVADSVTNGYLQFASDGSGGTDINVDVDGSSDGFVLLANLPDLAFVDAATSQTQMTDNITT